MSAAEHLAGGGPPSPLQRGVPSSGSWSPLARGGSWSCLATESDVGGLGLAWTLRARGRLRLGAGSGEHRVWAARAPRGLEPVSPPGAWSQKDRKIWSQVSQGRGVRRIPGKAEVGGGEVPRGTRKDAGVASPLPPPPRPLAAWTDKASLRTKVGGPGGGRTQTEEAGKWKHSSYYFLILKIKASSSLRAVLLWAGESPPPRLRGLTTPV